VESDSGGDLVSHDVRRARIPARAGVERLVRSAVRGTREGGEAGLTAVELAVAMVVLATLLVLAIPTMGISFNVQSQTNATYTGINETLQVANTLARFIRWAELPPSNATGYFTSQSSGSELQFYANVGTNYGSKGPALVDAKTVAVSGSVPQVYTLTLTVTPATGCTASPSNCAWSGSAITLATLEDVSVPSPFLYISIHQPDPTKLPAWGNNCQVPIQWPPPVSAATPLPAPCTPLSGKTAPANPWSATPSWSWSPAASGVSNNSLQDVLGVFMNLQTKRPNAPGGALETTAFLASQNSYLSSIG
jgi:Tfp pilus assembly protein FimT